MKRTFVLALGLLVAPQMASAQVELGLDFFGLNYSKVDGDDDASISVGIPESGLRVGFNAGPQMIIETRMEFDWDKHGDESGRNLILVPGLNYLVNDQVYVRGNIGLANFSFDPGTGTSVSGTQYIFGGAVGIRRALGSGAVLRVEGGADQWLENQDDFLPSELDIHGSVGISAIVGG
jgi:hypothetical protein